ncbi:MAG TPA: PliI family lysozyme inhibitor of I-type lysozyme [Prolixibacteraceae bacterium]|nr:PliI family lysozyme inhibitor of I-type lysozyme [Prolixibacteraceae bacterium]
MPVLTKITSAILIALALSYCANRTKSVQETPKKDNTTESAGDSVPRRVFQKLLAFQNFSFDIRTTGEGSIQQLTIQPDGLSIDNRQIVSEIVGTATETEIADLNGDGFPEILVFTTSAGSGSYGDVIGYSVNNGKSMSRISFPSLADNPEASKGYMGHDQFRVAENRLFRQFRTYKPGDVNATPTGKIRQIQYLLKEGESSRIFVVDKIVEFPSEQQE